MTILSNLSRNSLGRTIGTIGSAALILVTFLIPHAASGAEAPATFVGIDGSYSSDAILGGKGDVRAYWRHVSDGSPARLKQVTIEAPSGQKFRVGEVPTLWISATGRPGEWGKAASIEPYSCVLTSSNEDMACEIREVEVPTGGTYVAVIVPTVISSNAASTGAVSHKTKAKAYLETSAGMASTAVHTAITDSPPLPFEVEVPVAGDRIVRGKGPVGGTVSLTDEDGKIATCIVADDGKWQIALPLGFGLLAPRIVDMFGAEQTASPVYFNSYLFSADQPTDGSTVATKVELHGDGQPGSAVVVMSVVGRPIAGTTVAEDGRWVTSLSDLPLGDLSLTLENTTSDGTTTSLAIGLEVVATVSSLQGTLRFSEGVKIADGVDAHVVTVAVTDSHAQPAANVPVVIALSRGADGRTVTTDRDGLAALEVRTTTAGLIHVRTTIDGVPLQPGTGAIRFVPGAVDPNVSRVEVSDEREARVADGADSYEIVALIFDAYANAIPNVAVSETSEEVRQHEVEPRTAENGRVSIEVSSVRSGVHPTVIRAAAVVIAELELRFVPGGADPEISEFNVRPDNFGTDPDLFIAEVVLRDAQGNPISGQLVTFESAGPSITSALALTDIRGAAHTTFVISDGESTKLVAESDGVSLVVDALEGTQDRQ